jgi:hypothetical protein
MIKALARHRTLLSAGLTVVILGLLAWKAGIRLEVVAEQLRRLNWPLFAGILVLSQAWHMLLGSDKWWRILRALGAHVGFWEVFRVRTASDPIRFAAPMKSGEIVNAAYFARLQNLGFSRAAGSVVFDKALNFFGTVVWLYVGIVAMAQLPTAGYVGFHSALGASVLVLICFRPVRRAAVGVAAAVHGKLGRLAEGVLSAFEEFSPARKFGFLLYGVIFQIRPLAVCALLFIAFQPERLPSLQEFLALGSLVVLMSNIPSLGGIGPREATLMAVFAGYAEPSTLLSVGVLMSFSVQVLPALVGVPFMFRLWGELAAGVDQPAVTPATSPVESDGAALPLSPLE